MQALEICATVLVDADDLGIDHSRGVDAPRFFDDERVEVRRASHSVKGVEA